MKEELPATEIAQMLVDDKRITESYVLVRELKLLLKFKEGDFSPTVRVKIYLTDPQSQMPYHFDTSHYVHTPDQATPYMTSRTMASSETEAIDLAIRSLTSFVPQAIEGGHVAHTDWFVPNEYF
ncbi:MAG TPA: hypothetical protein VF598_08440 [Hymenobacter sp.]|jgi:hypothetical protein